MAREQALHDRALNADAPAMNQTYLGEPALVRGRQVIVDHRRNIARRERMQVEGVLDGDRDGVVVAQKRGPPTTCCCQCWKLERSSPESLHCQKVAERSKNATSTRPTFSARAVSATFCVTICRTNGIGMRPRR